MKKILKIFILIIALFGLIFWVWQWKINSVKKQKEFQGSKIEVENNLKEKDVSQSFSSKDGGMGLEDKEGSEKQISPLEKIKIDVPFSSQAPFGKWDDLHEESCEEMSLIMLKYYQDKRILTPEMAEKELQSLVSFEKRHLGHFEDSNAAEIVKLARDFYGMDNLHLVYDFNRDDLKKYLSLGRPIIIPAAGRLLGNPNFKAPGPLYHNLVLVGYEESDIITNDPGTKRGKEYKYNIDILFNAIHDFPGKKDEIEQGRKVMIIINE